MPEIAWHFTKQTPDMKSRDAMQQKFFELDKAMVVSLIRESIQNSLDAKDIGTEGPVQVRVFISGHEHALSRSQTEPFLTDAAWQHFNALNNGLDSIRPGRDEPCHYIVIEDFGTKGLNGDILQWSKPDKGQNHFYHFFRAEGQSDKGLSKASRGKHGVGKIVFPMTSRLKTFFGLTVRKEDGKKYLVGQSVLKHHKVDGAPYTPDGWFGYFNGDHLAMPIDNDTKPELVSEFSHTFNLKRTTENGLSVVIPYVSEEIENHAILKAIVEDYFWAILKEILVISISSPYGEFSIEKGSLTSVLATLNLDDELEAKIELAKWAADYDQKTITNISAPKATAPPKWDKSLIDPELQIQLRKRLEAEETIAIRIPLTIRKRKDDEGQSTATYYDVFLQRNQNAKTGRPVFIREGIIVPNASRNKRSGTLALVIAEDPLITDFLGDAEGPAHTEWSANSEDFKNKYIYDWQTLHFIKSTVGGIIDILDESSKQEDRTLLLDFFSIPVPVEGPKRESTKRKKKDGDETEGPNLDIPSKPKRFKVTKVQGGFTVSSADKPVALPAMLEVKVFYDRRGGTAKYSPHDFRLDKPPIRYTGNNVDKLEAKENKLKVQIINPEFKLTVLGFDVKRDLLVKPTVTELKGDNGTS